MMLFSIIVPVYKVEQYLDRCVNSILNQTYSDIEVILVDDGSPDNCPIMCDNYAIKDNRVKVLHKQNGGLSDARNVGLQLATGKYIMFVDSDDYIEQNACEAFLKYTSLDCDIIIGDAVVEGSSLNLSHISYNEKIYSGLNYLLEAYVQKKAPMAVWLNIYKRSFLLNNNLFFKYGILHEDEEFTPRAFLFAETVLVSDVIFYHYIVRPDSITTKKNQRKNAIDLFETCCELEIIYRAEIKDYNLKKLLLDSLVCKYLSLFQSAKLYRYGKDYYHKAFIIKNAYILKTKCKSLLYFVSPILYYYANNCFKYVKNKLIKWRQR